MPRNSIPTGLGAAMLALCAGLAACGTPRTPDDGGRREAGRTVASGGPVDLTLIGDARACAGRDVVRGRQTLRELADGSLATRAPMAINADGSGRAYHRDNAAGGAILHLCNAGEVFLPDGSSYHGSVDNATCTGRFMDDLARIEAAGWNDPSVGAIRWYGIAATGAARINGVRVSPTTPLTPSAGGGFYVSPTSLQDLNFDISDQRRYVDALSVPHAVVRADSGIPLGTLGVAVRLDGCGSARRCDPVPFIVADHGPRIGEGSIALSRRVSGLAPDTPITRENRFAGAVDGNNVLWVFFGGAPIDPPYTADVLRVRGAVAFEAWGGPDRIERCRRAEVPAVSR